MLLCNFRNRDHVLRLTGRRGKNKIKYLRLSDIDYPLKLKKIHCLPIFFKLQFVLNNFFLLSMCHFFLINYKLFFIGKINISNKKVKILSFEAFFFSKSLFDIFSSLNYDFFVVFAILPHAFVSFLIASNIAL